MNLTGGTTCFLLMHKNRFIAIRFLGGESVYTFEQEQKLQQTKFLLHLQFAFYFNNRCKRIYPGIYSLNVSRSI